MTVPCPNPDCKEGLVPRRAGDRYAQYGAGREACGTCGGAGALDPADARARELVKKAADEEAKKELCPCGLVHGTCDGSCSC